MNNSLLNIYEQGYKKTDGLFTTNRPSILYYILFILYEPTNVAEVLTMRKFRVLREHTV